MLFCNMDMSNMDTTSTCDYSDPYSESFHPFLLFRIVPVSYTHLTLPTILLV